MIKSIITKFISKYVTNISPENISYNLFTKTLDLYNVSINPAFLPNKKSNIDHLKYKFSFTKGLIIIRNMTIEISDLCLFNDSKSSFYDIEIYNIAIIYKDYKINIVEIINNIIIGAELFYKGHRILTTTKIYKNAHGWFIKKACVDFNNIHHFYKNKSDTQLLNFKYEINCKKAKIDNLHAYLKNVTVSKSEDFLVNFTKIKYDLLVLNDMKCVFKDKITISNDFLAVEILDGKINFKISKQLPIQFRAEATFCYNIDDILNIIQCCPKFKVEIIYLNDKISFTLNKDIYDLNFKDMLYVEKIEILDDIYFKYVAYKPNDKTDDVVNNDLMIDIIKSFNRNIIIDVLLIDNLCVKKLLFNNRSSDMYKIANYTIDTYANTIDFIKITHKESLFFVNMYDINITELEPILKLINCEESSLNLRFVFYNLHIFHKDIKFVSKETKLEGKSFSSNFDIIVNNHVFIDNCYLSSKKSMTTTDKLFINISDNILHTIYNLNIQNIFKVFGSNSLENRSLCLSVDKIFINFYNTANEEVFYVFLSNVDILHSSQNFSLNIKFAQIDNQDYTAKIPTPFKSLDDNFCIVNIANNEIFVSVGKFIAYFDDLLEKFSYIQSLVDFKTNNQITYNFNTIHINDIQCCVFYKYFVDLQINKIIVSSVSGTLKIIIERLVKIYRSKINKNVLGLIFRNIKNNIYNRPVYLGYKDDVNLPVPWYTQAYTECRIKYSMPMRYTIEKYDKGLCVAYYIFNKLENKYKDEIFRDGSFTKIFYKNKAEDSFIGENCIILTNRRLILSSRLNIKNICIEEICIKQSDNFFMIGDIKIEVERQSFILSLCRYLVEF